ncbi:MAG: ACP S-malonyltransferase [candidate division Zixibacteria bacterium]|nr:ACP S-malonyltransferase [candidate division Zixibacteria bacterium]
MNKVAAIFPGQGSQYVGMGKDLYESSSDVRALYEYASTLIGEDLAKISFEGPAERLKQTRFTQPAILVHSLAALEIMGEDIPPLEIVAGHSLGEYSALVCAGSLSAEEAIKLVVTRANLMEKASQAREGAMAAIVGLSEETLIKVCKDVSSKGIVVAANLNSSAQIVLSGDLGAVRAAADLAKEKGAKRAIMLEVGGAFHSPLMESALEGMKKALSAVTISIPQIGFVPNVTATKENTPDVIKQLLEKQITAPVRWLETMATIRESRVDTVIEIGPGKILSGLAKREIKPETIINLDTLASIRKFAAPVEV